jgi:ABC-type nitrate/sulfonate/bicarbonate transport system permease component
MSKYYPQIKFFISSPLTTIVYINANYSQLLEAFMITFLESISWIIWATILTFLIMIPLFYYPKITNILLPIAILSQIIPIITIAPLFIILFWIGIISKIAMSILICFFPVFIWFLDWINAINKNIIHLTELYWAKKYDLIKMIYIPLSLPYIFTGLKVAATLSVIWAVVAEFTWAEIWLWKNLYLASRRLDAEMMISSIFLTSIIWMMMYLIVYLIEKLIIGKWNR